MEKTGFAYVVREIDFLARNSRIVSRIGFVNALERIFHCFSASYVEKAFHYLFISKEVWLKTKSLYELDETPEDGSKNPYSEYILGPAHDWFMGEFDRTYSEGMGYSQHMWKIFSSCDSHDKPKRIALLYFVIDTISRSEFEDFSLEAENCLMGFPSNHTQIFLMH